MFDDVQSSGSEKFLKQRVGEIMLSVRKFCLSTQKLRKGALLGFSKILAPKKNFRDEPKSGFARTSTVLQKSRCNSLVFLHFGKRAD